MIGKKNEVQSVTQYVIPAQLSTYYRSNIRRIEHWDNTTLGELGHSLLNIQTRTRVVIRDYFSIA